MDRKENPMKHFIPITDLEDLFTSRAGETRLGEVITLMPGLETRYEILGIPESVGVRANYGIGGTETAWKSFLQVFLNLQSNRFLNGGNIFISGYFQFPDLSQAPVEELRNQVEEIDQEVSQKIYEIVSAGRIPIVIGGGHNNAYGNLKGTSQALGKPVSAINFDAHADFRHLEGRHSGNGFSYAMRQGYLGQYSVFGLQKSYAPEFMLADLTARSNVQLHYLDHLHFTSVGEFREAIQAALHHTSSQPLGIEIDLDTIENVLSSASSPVAFTVAQALQFVREVKTAPHLAYLHLCEGASRLQDERSYPLLGKLLAELVAEFVRQ